MPIAAVNLLVPRRAGQRGGGPNRVRAPVRAHDVPGLGPHRSRHPHGAPGGGRARPRVNAQHRLRLHRLHRGRAVQRAGAGVVAGERPHGVPARQRWTRRGCPTSRRSCATSAGRTSSRCRTGCRRGGVSSTCSPRATRTTRRSSGRTRTSRPPSSTDVRDFFARYYVPNNASLTIVGDIDVAATKALIEKYFGTIPRGPDVPEPQVATTPADRGAAADDHRPGRAAARDHGVGDRTRRTRPETPRPTWRPACSAAARPAGSTRHWCTGPESPRTSRPPAVAPPRLGVLDQGDGEARAHRRRAGGGHPARARCARRRRPDGGGAGRGQDHDPGGRRSSTSSTRPRVANRLNHYDHYLGDPGYLDRDLRRYADVDAPARPALRHRRAAARPAGGRPHRPGREGAAPRPAGPADAGRGNAPATRRPSAEQWRNTVPGLGPPRRWPCPVPRRFELDNGLPVYLVESHDLPITVASLVSRWGSAAEPAERPGLAAFTADMLDEGTQTRDALGIAREIDSLGVLALHRSRRRRQLRSRWRRCRPRWAGRWR